YGLDVQIVSPPHSLLAAGMFAVAVGAMLLLLRFENEATSERQVFRSVLYAFSMGVLISMASVFTTEYSYPNKQHGSLFYEVSCATYPLYLTAAVRTSKLRWPAVTAASVYTALLLALVWILPLFPATPLLAPIYNRLDHMAAPPFPLLLIAPAFGIDLVVKGIGAGQSWWKDWVIVFLIAAVFLAILLPVQWFFSEFLISPAAENWFFAGGRFYPYFDQLGDWTREFWDVGSNPVSVKGLRIAFG